MDSSDDKDPLLPVTSSVENSEEVTRVRRYVPMIEITAVLFFIPVMALSPIQQFYVIDEISKQYGQHGKKEENYCPTTTNDTNNSTSTTTSDKIQTESANILMYLSFFSTFLSVIPILIMGAIADRFGRKPPLIMSMVGMLLKEAVYIFIVYEELSLWFLVLGEFFQGITGHFGAPLATLIGMIADITPPGGKRAFRISILEAAVAISLALSTLGVGFWIKDGSYKHPLIFCISCTAFALLVTIFCLPETSTTHKQKQDRTKFQCRDLFGGCYRLYQNDAWRRKVLIVGQVIFSIYVAAVVGRSNTLTLFVLHEPLCWSELHVQIFSCAQMLINWGAVILVVKVLHVFLNDYGIVVISALFSAGCLVTVAFSQQDWTIYLSVIVGLAGYTMSPVMRSLLSRHVSSDEQGSLFASVGSLELLFTSVAQLIYGEMYKATVTWFPGFAFLVMAGVLGVAFLLSLYLVKLLSSREIQQAETIVEVD